ncbi:NADH:flavin oxidoreductase/NADH oxidase [Nesterenkonia sphaerica]|uniref:NADH:flavin oxidoreductase/NADH oxidase n=1 Tax=Nesterenkonia sphaerica TaxID=1804988 RepID=UPI0026986540
MNRVQPKLFEPITLRGHTVRNRIWIPPMCQYSAFAQDGVATDWHLAHLGSFARGGAGAVIAEATSVTAEGRISPEDLGLWSDEQEEALKRIVSFVHSQGASAGIQLAHAGRKASTFGPFAEESGSVPRGQGGWQTLGSTEEPFQGLEAPQALDSAGISRIVAAFAASAERALRAGFDLIEIHAAHGYLLHEFLSPLSNTRNDAYGGSLAGRARLLLEVVDAVRTQVGPQVPVLVRVSATDWVEEGLTLDDTVELAQWLKDHGVDLIDVSSGGNVPVRFPVGPGYQVPLAAAIGTQTGMPVAAVGLITDPVQAEHILFTGQADVVLIGREALRDPHFGLRAAQHFGHSLPYVPTQYSRGFGAGKK